DVEDFLAVGHGVPAFFHFGGVVALGHLVEIGIGEVDTFDFLLRQMARRVADGEAAFAGAVQQVGGGVGEVLHVGVGLVLGHAFGRATVAVFADEGVDVGLLAEAFEARRKD